MSNTHFIKNTTKFFYKDKMKDLDGFSDVLNGQAYEFEKNTFNLALFADAATYTKSANKSMWAIFSTLLELPPSLRCKSENVIFHSSWFGSDLDTDIFLKKYNKQITHILKHGLDFNGVNIRFKVHLFMGDAPARAKFCNIKQFNGAYGCIKCLHPTFFIGHK